MRLCAWSGAVVVSLVLTATPARGAILEHLHFETGEGRTYGGGVRETPEIEIDDTLTILWDRGALVAELARSADGTLLAGPESGMLDSLETLEAGIRLFYGAQSLLLAAKNAREALSRIESSGGNADEARSAFERASREYADFTLEALDTLEPYRAREPALHRELNEAVLTDYRQVASVLERRLDSLRADLERIVEERRFWVQMTAAITDDLGFEIPVHLEGYDEIPIGAPVPFARYQFAVDERTERELGVAARLEDLLREILDGGLSSEIEEALRGLRGELDRLVEELRVNVLRRGIDDLRTDLAAARDEALGPLLDDLRDLRDLLGSLGDLPHLEGRDESERLIALADLLVGAAERLARAAELAPPRLEDLAGRLEALLRERPGLISGEAVATVRRAVSSFLSRQQALRRLAGSVRELAADLRPASGVARALLDAARIPRRLAEGVSLDTRADLQTIRGIRRRPGDRLVIRVRVLRGEHGDAKPATVFEGRTSFVLEAYGWYLRPGGALVFADPRGGAPGQSYEASPALGFHWHVGLRGRAFWNRGLDPGVGFTFTLLDFDDARDLELGVAVGASLFRSLLWAGYGRNLQADTDYFYVGLNPIVLVRLARGR